MHVVHPHPSRCTEYCKDFQFAEALDAVAIALLAFGASQSFIGSGEGWVEWGLTV